MNYTLRDPNGNVLLAVESSPVVTEADMTADLDKAAKACESAFDEVIKYQDAMAVMSSEGFGEQAKAVASKVWEKIKEFFKRIINWFKDFYKQIVIRLHGLSEKIKSRKKFNDRARDNIVDALAEFKRSSGKSTEAFDPDARATPSFNPDKVSDMKFDFSRANTNSFNPDKLSSMKFDFSKEGCERRAKEFANKLSSVINLINISFIKDSAEFNSNISKIKKYIELGKTETDAEKLNNYASELNDINSSLKRLLSTNEESAQLNKDIDRHFEFDPDDEVTPAVGNAARLAEYIANATKDTWSDVIKGYAVSTDIVSKSDKDISTALDSLIKMSETSLREIENNPDASDEEIRLANARAKYVNTCKDSVTLYSKEISNCIKIANLSQETSDIINEVRDRILLAKRIEEQKKTEARLKLRDGPRIM